MQPLNFIGVLISFLDLKGPVVKKPSFMKILLFLTFLSSFSAFAREFIPNVSLALQESKQIDWDRAVSETVEIDAPVSEVWKYVSDSTRAHEWSVFFDHITPLSSGVPDGHVGSLRTCYRNENEQGKRWSEVTLEVLPRQRRQIATFDLVNFGFKSFTKTDYALVRQIYIPVDGSKTVLKFQTLSSPSSSHFSKIAFEASRRKTDRKSVV